MSHFVLIIRTLSEFQDPLRILLKLKQSLLFRFLFPRLNQTLQISKALEELSSIQSSAIHQVSIYDRHLYPTSNNYGSQHLGMYHQRTQAHMGRFRITKLALKIGDYRVAHNFHYQLDNDAT